MSPDLDPELSQLCDRWIIAFLEAPVVLDAELMRRLLAEHHGETAEQPS